MAVLFGKSEGKDFVGNAGEEEEEEEEEVDCVKLDLTNSQYDNGYQDYMSS